MTKHAIFKLTLIVLAVLSVAFGKIRYTDSDPRATLLVADAILTQHTIKLDHYGEKLLKNYGYVLHQKNGHFYYFFPIGTSVMSLPVVALAKGFGFNIQQNEPTLQMVISAGIAALLMLCLIILARIFLNPMSAMLIAAVFWFGSSFASTMGTALWSHNFATLFATMAILFSIQATYLDRHNRWPLVAISLFTAYFCRPVLSLLSPFVLLYLFSYDKKMALKAAFLLGLFLLAFVGFSLYEFHQLLPDYYMPKRLQGGQFWLALYGNLFSPARGILIYSPFIVMSWLCWRPSTTRWRLKKSWLFIALAWPIAHWVVISRFPHWWAGYSYGPRFMTDILPGLFLLTIYTWPRTLQGRFNKIFIGVLACSAMFAVFINTAQGLFNGYTAQWNGSPNVDSFPEYLFDWRYPQFLANKDGHKKRLLNHIVAHMPAIMPSEILDSRSTKVVFSGWVRKEPIHRGTDRKWGSFYFNIVNPQDYAGELTISAFFFGVQHLDILLNRQKIFSGEFNPTPQRFTAHFSPGLLKKGVNVVQFDLTDTHKLDKEGPKNLGMALASFSLR